MTEIIKTVPAIALMETPLCKLAEEAIAWKLEGELTLGVRHRLSQRQETRSLNELTAGVCTVRNGWARVAQELACIAAMHPFILLQTNTSYPQIEIRHCIGEEQNKFVSKVRGELSTMLALRGYYTTDRRAYHQQWIREGNYGVHWRFSWGWRNDLANDELRAFAELTRKLVRGARDEFGLETPQLPDKVTIVY